MCPLLPLCPLLPSVGRGSASDAMLGELLVPRARLAIIQRGAFSVAGPSAWNDLPVEHHSLQMSHSSKFYISLKSFFFGRNCAWSAPEFPKFFGRGPH